MTSYNQMLKNLKYEVPLRGFAELVTDLHFVDKDKRLMFDEYGDARPFRELAKVLAANATFTTLTASGAVVGGSILTAGINGPAAAYATATSLIGANTLALGIAATGGAVIGVGMLAAGVFDIMHQLNCLEKGSFFKLDSLVQFGLKSVTTVISAPISVCYLLAHATLFLGFLMKGAWDFVFNREALKKDGHELSENFRSVCFNLAAIILFPVINFVDLAGGVVKKVKDEGHALACRAIDAATHSDCYESSSLSA